MRNISIAGIEAMKRLPLRLVQQINANYEASIRDAAFDLAMEARELLPYLIFYYRTTKGQGR